MIIKINGFALNDPSTRNGCYLDEPIDGLGLPEIRISSGNNSGRDGGWVGAQFYGMRQITLTGHMFGTDAADLDNVRKNLAAACAASPLTIDITTNGGAQYQLTASLDQLQMPISRAPNMANYSLSLIAPDPNIYDNSAGGAISATVNLLTSGGLTWPITWPITWGGAGAPTSVINTGDVTIYPTIELSGVMTNPMITNKTTGQFFELTGLTTSESDVVTIDMKNRTVLFNGGSILPYMTITSTWWPLVVGDNDLTLISTSSSDDVVATVSWQAAYRGI